MTVCKCEPEVFFEKEDVTGDVGKDGLYQAFDYLKLI